ncbi:MAG: hypothetical protein Q8K32_12845 [Archangium sp.]|nr:hypothetical protein [Archangium sp.]
MPWSLDASARLTGVGFTPSAQGGGAEVGAAFALAGGRWLQLGLGPRLTVDFTAFSGRFIALSAALELRAKPHALVWLDLRATPGLVQVVASDTIWVVRDGNLGKGQALVQTAGRVGLSLGVGLSLRAGSTSVRPFARYEQSLILGFSPAGGIPLLPLGNVSLGVAVDLGTEGVR